MQSFCLAHWQHGCVDDHDPRACPPTRDWPFFYFEKLGLIAFTKEQLLYAAGSSSIRAVTKALRERKWLHTNEAGRSDMKLLTDMKGIVPAARAFQLLAEPVLGELLRSAKTGIAGPVVSALPMSKGFPFDSDEVIQDEYTGDQDAIGFDSESGPSDESYNYERELNDPEGNFNLVQGDSYQMPNRWVIDRAKH